MAWRRTNADLFSNSIDWHILSHPSSLLGAEIYPADNLTICCGTCCSKFGGIILDSSTLKQNFKLANYYTVTNQKVTPSKCKQTDSVHFRFFNHGQSIEKNWKIASLKANTIPQSILLWRSANCREISPTMGNSIITSIIVFRLDMLESETAFRPMQIVFMITCLYTWLMIFIASWYVSFESISVSRNKHHM